MLEAPYLRRRTMSKIEKRLEAPPAAEPGTGTFRT